MQTSKKNIDNSEKRLRFYETFNLLRSHFTTSKLKTILLVCLISFTSLLVRQTLQIQHSCNPMIHWSGEFSAECQVAVKNDFDSFDKFSSIRTRISKNESSNFNDFSSLTKQELKTSKQQPQIAQNIFESQPNQITYGRPSPTPESSQHNTETKSKNLLDVVVEVVVVIKNFLWWWWGTKRFL